MFVDEAVILVRSGKGGDGCISFRREKYIPRGGPDGGDGGRGGDVIIEADPQLATLGDVSRRSIFHAKDGRAGQGSNCYGRRGDSLTISVPVGTIVRAVVERREPREGPVLADLSERRQRVVVARGGKGGRGNKAFASSTNQVPRIADEGGPAVERRIYLELKLLADVGLIGLPNAGKSTLLSRLSSARPKIGAYPFTTLQPNLGLAELDYERRLVFADIPGLIEGAHEGHGLGIEFLRHVERTRVLVHLLSVEAGDRDKLLEDFRTIETELAEFDADLARKPRCVVLSKCDIVSDERSQELARSFTDSSGVAAIRISAVTGAGVEPFLTVVERLVKEAEEAAEKEEE